jgi:hypothetical protein
MKTKILLFAAVITFAACTKKRCQVTCVTTWTYYNHMPAITDTTAIYSAPCGTLSDTAFNDNAQKCTTCK